MGPAALLPLRRKARWGFEPATLGTKVSTLTSRPPKPLILTFEDLKILLKIFKFYSNMRRIMGTFHENLCTFIIISDWILFRMITFWPKLGKIKAHLMLNNFFPRKSLRLRSNVNRYGTAKQARDYKITCCMRFACWLPKATNTHS